MDGILMEPLWNGTIIVDLVTVIIRGMEHGFIQKENHEKNI